MRYQRVEDKIIIQQPRTGAIVFSLLFLSLIIGLPWLMLGMPKNLHELESLDRGFVGELGLNAGFFILAGLPLFTVPSLIKNLRIAVKGKAITFDGTAKKIFRNNKELIDFSKIQNFDFKNMEGLTVELDCLLHNGKKIKLGEIGDAKDIKMYKTDILDVVQFTEKTLDERPVDLGFGKIFAIIHYIFLTISILLLIGSLYALSSAIMFNLFGTTTSGKVIDTRIETTQRMVESGRVGRPKKKVRATSTVYIFTIEYQDAEGNRHTFETSALDGGASVPVVYFKFWPEYARVKSFSGNWGPFVFLLVFGAIIFFMSQLFNEKFFAKIKRKKEQKKLSNERGAS